MKEPISINKYKLSKRLLPFIGIVVLLIEGLILTESIDNWLDLHLWDETLYLKNGIYFFINSPQSDWGPLYSLWYFILNLFTSDAVNLYLLNQQLMMIILPVTVFIYLFRLTENVNLSFFYSYLLLISSMNIHGWPKVSHFNTILLLFSSVILIKIKSDNKRLLIAGITALAATYVRPEFIVTFFIFFSIMVFKVIKRVYNWNYFVGFAIISIVLFFIMGNPFSSSRSLTAFIQGYEYSMPLNQRIDEYGKIKEWPEILEDNFKNPDSFFEVIINYPREVKHHLFFNIKSLGNIRSNLEELIFPSQFIHISNPILPIILVCLVSLFPIILIFISYTDKNISYYNKFYDLKFLAILILIFSIPPLLGMILFTLRLHYIILLLPLFYTIIAVVFLPFKIQNTIKEIFIFVLIVVISFIYVPDSSWFGKPPLKNRKTIEYIRDLELKDKINILEGNGGYVYYLGDNFEWIKISTKTQPFSEFVSDKKINMIIDSNKLSTSAYLKRDSTWNEFLNDPQSLGFKRQVLESGMDIFLKDNLY